ncbi:MAG: PilX N-terminal domain-containing pilus assembly protein [Candidatus Acidiferrales bacterium]
MRTNRENGIALLTVILVMLLISAMVVGMSWMVMTDARLGGNNQGRETAFYGAEAGMEKLTADIGNIYATKGSVVGGDLTSAPVTVPPTIPGIQFQNALGQSTYTVTCNGCPANPTATNATILPPSPYAGMNGLITPYTLTVAAQTGTGSEVKLQRQVQLVSIPVFQFGIFSQTDLSFFAGPVFDFGGRVHTNGNLWLAANTGPLYLADKVTVSGQVIRSNLENGYPGGGGSITAGGTYGGTVNISLVPLPIPPNPARPPYVAAQWRALAQNEGSVIGPSVYGAVNTTLNNPAWSNAVVAYGGMLENDAPQLNLTSTALAGLSTPITLIERPVPGEEAGNPGQFFERYFAGGGVNQQVSLRILLDNYGPSGTCTDSDMTKLDTVTATVPIDLATLAFNGAPGAAAAWYTGTYPLPLSDASAANYPSPTYKYTSGTGDGYWQTKGTPIMNGCIKIEYETAGGAYTDVTKEILNLGFTGQNIYPVTAGATNQLQYLPASGGATIAVSGCANPSPNAIIRLARLRDNPSTAYGAHPSACTATTSGYDYWPNVLYDPREGVSRDNALPNDANDAASNHPEITAEGAMHYIELDMGNLQKWFAGTIGASGANASNVGGYEVYFSDRRGNVVDPAVGLKTGFFGFDDIINGPTDPANGCPNNAIDPGEDFAGDGVLRLYGGVPLITGATNGTTTITSSQGIPSLLANLSPSLGLVLTKNPNCAVAAPTPSPVYIYAHAQEARENPPVFFRRALKIVDAQTINLGTACYGAAPNPPCGITIASENPVYLQGEFNDGGVNTGAWTGASVAASVAADSVTLLSDSWNDINSFVSPYAPGSRVPVTTSYRVAIVSGKGIPFVEPAGTAQDYGTDGGLHNFLRFLEGWGGTVYYRGSLVSFFYSAQGIGPYKCCTTVYSAPNREYTFDENFTLGPQWLPPRTPTLRSINTVGFTQQILPTQ